MSITPHMLFDSLQTAQIFNTLSVPDPEIDFRFPDGYLFTEEDLETFLSISRILNKEIVS